MRKIIATVYLSVDGVMEDPMWTMPYWNNQHAQYADDLQQNVHALLLGRITYEGFAEAWPNMPEEEGASFMNNLPKYVASNTLTDMTWNASLIEGDVVKTVTNLKNEDGGNLLIYGSSELINTLLPHNLIDELHLWVHPVVVGSGKKLFNDNRNQINLKLTDTTIFDSGTIVLTYAPDTSTTD